MESPAPATDTDTLPAQPATNRRDCALCGAPPSSGRMLAYGNAEWPMRQCVCGFVYLEKAPVYEELASNLAWEKSHGAETERRMKEDRVAQTISKKTRWRMHLFKRRNMTELLVRSCAEGDVLDIGCATGLHLMGLPPEVRPHGIEISEYLGRQARENFESRGGTAYIGPALHVMRELPSGKFAAIAMRSYLEHEAQPSDVLAEAQRILKPGGVLFIKVPNYASANRFVRGRKWCGFRLPDHLNYFTPSSLARMLRAAKFSVKQPWSWRLPTGDNMWVEARILRLLMFFQIGVV